MKARKHGIRRKRCTYCPQFTANGDGICPRCLNLGVANNARLPEWASEETLARRGNELSKRAQAILTDCERATRIPAALSRGVEAGRHRGNR